MVLSLITHCIYKTVYIMKCSYILQMSVIHFLLITTYYVSVAFMILTLYLTLYIQVKINSNYSATANRIPALFNILFLSLASRLKTQLQQQQNYYM
jgi:hypothetical protein